MDENPYLNRRKWWRIERERELESSYENRPETCNFPVACDGSRGGDQSGVEEESGPVRLGPVPSIEVARDGGGVGGSVRVNSNRKEKIEEREECSGREKEKVR
ncbi:unnamed protein product [Prunus armeniaca]